jgi:hypothetical protein
MILQSLISGVEHAEEADLSAEVIASGVVLPVAEGCRSSNSSRPLSSLAHHPRVSARTGVAEMPLRLSFVALAPEEWRQFGKSNQR